ncbi:ABC transporter permease [Demequina flava]|uniref:ABC transporter permease n=1 Tax=Demequina flava TaxID=1095025 RepID=UPI000783DA5D|nr:ABC transporter permease [Demequina flava]
MSAAIRAEVRKLLTTRLWWVLALSLALGVIFMVAVIVFSFAFAEELGATGADQPDASGMDPEMLATMVYSLPVSFGYVFPAVLGALSLTSEYRHRTIDTTLLMDPRRGRLIAAKLIAIVPFGLLYGVLAMSAGVVVGGAGLALTDSATFLTSASMWGSIAMGVVALAVWAVVGVGLGAAIPNQVMVIVLLVGWTQLAEPILRLALGLIEPLQGVAAYLPGAAGDAMVGASFYSAMEAGNLLAPWAGFAVLLAYGLIAGVIGWLRMTRRDVG